MSPRREIVEAGAGCGKTYSLVQRYLEGLGVEVLSEKPLSLRRHAGFSPSSILALTFTEKAAEEMLERILKRLAELELHDLREEVLRESRISTFHSLCYRLLQPHLESLGYSRSDLVPTALAQDRRRRHALNALPQSPQRDQLLSHLKLSQITQLGADLWFQKASGSADPTPLFEEWAQKVAAFQRQHVANIRNILKTLDPEVRKKLNAENWLQTFLESLENPRPEDISRMHLGRGPRTWKTQYPELYSAVGLWKALLKSGLWEALNSQARHEEAHVQQSLQAFLCTLRETGPRLLDFSALEAELHAYLKKQSGETLLTPPRLLLVDEFQDTNRTQYEILKALSGPTTEWYFVGDPKQSIYRFRGAEAALFRELSESLTRLQLGSNYRSQEPVLAFINACQSQLFDPERPLDPPAQILSSGLSPEKKSSLPHSVVLTEATSPKTSFGELLAADYHARSQELGPLATHAALFCQWKSLYQTAQELRTRGIPVLIQGTEPVLDHHLTHLWAAFLKWIENPELAGALESWQRWSALPPPLHFSFWRDLPWITLFQHFTQLLQPHRWKKGKQWTSAMERWLRSLQNSGCELELSLTELAQFLLAHRLQAESAPAQGIWSQSEVPGVLQLFTIHASKGLQFDVVYLPDLRERSGSHFQLAESSDSTEELSFNIHIHDPHTQTSHPSLLFAHQKTLAQRELEAESRRLFYVALTRPQKALHLYWHAPRSKATGNPEAGTLLGWPARTPDKWPELLGNLRASPHWPRSFEEQGSWVWRTLEEEEQPPLEAATEDWRLPESPAAISPAPPFFREGVSPYLERLHPSPLRFQSLSEKTARPNSHNDFSATEAGEYLHRILENWNGNSDTLSPLLEGAPPAWKGVLEQAALSVFSHPELENLSLAWKDPTAALWKEFGLYIHSNDYRLSGVADLVWEETPSQLWIVDWKTSRRLSTLKRSERREKIRHQLELYARSFGSRYSKIRILALGIEFQLEKSSSRSEIILDEWIHP